MKILGDKRERVEVTYRRRVTGVKCDCCHTIIEPPTNTFGWKPYYTVILADDDSRDNYDICPHCVGNFVNDYLVDNEGQTDIHVEIWPDFIYVDQFTEEFTIEPVTDENAERCVACGAEIPEGRHVCPGCEGEAK